MLSSTGRKIHYWQLSGDTKEGKMVWQLKKNPVKDFTEPKWQLWKNGQIFWECIKNGKGIRNKNNE